MLLKLKLNNPNNTVRLSNWLISANFAWNNSFPYWLLYGSEHKRNVTRHKILGKIGDISYIFELHNTFETSLSTIEHRCRLWLTFANLVLQLDVAYLNDHLTLKQLTEIRTFWKAKVYEKVFENTEMMKTPATDWFQKSFILMY